MANPELMIVHRFNVLAAEADAVGLTLTASQLQFLLRKHSDQQVYASCASLGQVDEALRGRRQETRPGGDTKGLAKVLRCWLSSSRH